MVRISCYRNKRQKSIHQRKKLKNVEADDIRSARFPVSSYLSDNRSNFGGIDSPTPIDQIKKVEKQNEMAINVFGYEDKSITVYRLSERSLD